MRLLRRMVCLYVSPSFDRVKSSGVRKQDQSCFFILVILVLNQTTSYLLFSLVFNYFFQYVKERFVELKAECLRLKAFFAFCFLLYAFSLTSWRITDSNR